MPPLYPHQTNLYGALLKEVRQGLPYALPEHASRKEIMKWAEEA